MGHMYANWDYTLKLWHGKWQLPIIPTLSPIGGKQKQPKEVTKKSPISNIIGRPDTDDALAVVTHMFTRLYGGPIILLWWTTIILIMCKYTVAAGVN